MAGIAISIVPILTLYFVMQRYIVAGITAGASENVVIARGPKIQ